MHRTKGQGWGTREGGGEGMREKARRGGESS